MVNDFSPFFESQLKLYFFNHLHTVMTYCYPFPTNTHPFLATFLAFPCIFRPQPLQSLFSIVSSHSWPIWPFSGEPVTVSCQPRPLLPCSIHCSVLALFISLIQILHLSVLCSLLYFSSTFNLLFFKFYFIFLSITKLLIKVL